MSAHRLSSSPVSDSLAMVTTNTESETEHETSSQTTRSSSRTTPGSAASESANILDRLRAPRESDLARKRKVKANPPVSKKKCRTATGEPKSVSPSERVQKYPNESLVLSGGSLFCSACREEVSLKSSIIFNHIKSAKHKAGKERLQQKQAKEADIASALRVYNESVHLRGETLPEQQQVFRVKVVSCFLRAAVPLSKVDLFRPLLEETAFRLTDRRHLMDYIPLIL